MIEARGLTKNYGDKIAVNDLTFTVEPGRVTGFLGPNGAGKSTTMRMIMGLAAPTSGTVTVNGKDYRDLPAPLHEVGSLLEAKAVHTGRSAFDHLLALAQTHGIGKARVSEVIDLVGIGDVARKRVGGFSLGMGQRLGIAAALLGDPGVLVLDEPANGLDPEGIAWLRAFLRHLASQGRTVLVSSHVLSEVEQTVDDVVIVARGRLVKACPLTDLTVEDNRVAVRTPQVDELIRALQVSAPEAVVTAQDDGSLLVEHVEPAVIGRAALDGRVELHELRAVTSDLEQVFLSLTTGAKS